LKLHIKNFDQQHNTLQLYGEEYAYDDPVSQSISRMTTEVLKAIDVVSLGTLLDSFPVLFKQNIFLKETQKQIHQTRKFIDESLYKKIAEYKVSHTYKITDL